MLQPGFKPDLFTYLNIYNGNRWGLGASCFHELIRAARHEAAAAVTSRAAPEPPPAPPPTDRSRLRAAATVFVPR